MHVNSLFEIPVSFSDFFELQIESATVNVGFVVFGVLVNACVELNKGRGTVARVL